VQFIRIKVKRKAPVMELSDQIINQERKIKKLEMELNDLRQGLATVRDFYHDLQCVSEKQEASESSEQEVVQPLNDEDREFDGIWRFHRERLIADPSARVPRAEMYDAFVRYNTKTSRYGVEQDAFEFVFARIKDPSPMFTRGEWRGYRLRNI
jgi:DICT domain-containing protein